MKTLTFAVALAAVVSGAALAAPAPTAERAKVLQQVVDCRKVSADSDRLACYDKATAVLDEAEKKGDVVVVDKAQAQEVRRQSFGFSLPSLTIFNRAAKDEKNDQLEATVESASENAFGRYVFHTTDGAVWVQTDGDLPLTPKAGQPLLIYAGTLGSYFCKVNHQPAVRCRRQN